MHAVALAAGSGNVCTGLGQVLMAEVQVTISRSVAIDSMSWHANLKLCCSKFASAFGETCWLAPCVNDRLLQARTSLSLADFLGPTLLAVSLTLRLP